MVRNNRLGGAFNLSWLNDLTNLEPPSDGFLGKRKVETGRESREEESESEGNKDKG